jgi:NTE family protein
MISDSKDLKDWLKEGPFTLALSSSFFGFYAHCGIAAALYEKGFVPTQLTGSSAGALVAGGLASGFDPIQLSKLLFEIRRKDFWDPKIGLGFLKGGKFREIMQNNFANDFAKTKIPLEVAAVELFSMKTRFLNSGNLPDAVYASCAVPLMFHPIKIDGRLFIDGGVLNKSGVNPKHSGKRTLSVYLENLGRSAIYEFKKKRQKLPENVKILRIPDSPIVGPQNMEKGPEIFWEMYRKTMSTLS